MCNATDKSADYEICRRHTASHIMTAAVKMLRRDAKLGVGPWTDEGFYQDFDFGDEPLSDKDFKKIEKKMRWIVNKNMPIRRAEVDAARAREIFADDEYKLELINEIADRGEDISFYYFGETLEKALSFDLCAGPHLASTGEIGIFKLMKIAGAYWRGDSDKAMMTRIYGVAFGEQQPGYCPNTFILWDVGVEGCNIQSAEHTSGWS